MPSLPRNRFFRRQKRNTTNATFFERICRFTAAVCSYVTCGLCCNTDVVFSIDASDCESVAIQDDLNEDKEYSSSVDESMNSLVLFKVNNFDRNSISPDAEVLNIQHRHGKRNSSPTVSGLSPPLLDNNENPCNAVENTESRWSGIRLKNLATRCHTPFSQPLPVLSKNTMTQKIIEEDIESLCPIDELDNKQSEQHVPCFRNMFVRNSLLTWNKESQKFSCNIDDISDIDGESDIEIFEDVEILSIEGSETSDFEILGLSCKQQQQSLFVPPLEKGKQNKHKFSKKETQAIDRILLGDVKGKKMAKTRAWGPTESELAKAKARAKEVKERAKIARKEEKKLRKMLEKKNALKTDAISGGIPDVAKTAWEPTGETSRKQGSRKKHKKEKMERKATKSIKDKQINNNKMNKSDDDDMVQNMALPGAANEDMMHMTRNHVAGTLPAVKKHTGRFKKRNKVGIMPLQDKECRTNQEMQREPSRAGTYFCGSRAGPTFNATAFARDIKNTSDVIVSRERVTPEIAPGVERWTEKSQNERDRCNLGQASQRKILVRPIHQEDEESLASDSHEEPFQSCQRQEEC